MVGPCSATYCEPAKQYQVSRGRSDYLPRQGPSNIYLWEDYSRKTTPASKVRSEEFELDGRSPEVVTANQRACEIWIRDWVESQGVVITR